MPVFFRVLDPYLIWFYRLTGHALPDFFIGTFVLAVIVLVLGEFSISLAFLANKRHIDQFTREVVKYQNISVDALKAGDEQAYAAANKLANDAFGKSFFQQIALSAAFLWPIPFALAWMQFRFLEVEFPIPLIGISVNFMVMFLVVYVAAYFLFKRVKYRLPFFRRIKVILDSYEEQLQEMKSLVDLAAESKTRVK